MSPIRIRCESYSVSSAAAASLVPRRSANPVAEADLRSAAVVAAPLVAAAGAAPLAAAVAVGAEVAANSCGCGLHSVPIIQPESVDPTGSLWDSSLSWQGGNAGKNFRKVFLRVLPPLPHIRYRYRRRLHCGREGRGEGA